MIKTTIGIDGMMCGMCETHISETIRKCVPEAKKVSASHKKGCAEFVSENEPDREKLKKAIDETGYSCLSIESGPYEKKKLFGIF
ncbi:MAG: cation transporter [Lachnospiraceae bacterium]|nr:cation transporter [Lachnospiraceae bacterium]